MRRVYFLARGCQLAWLLWSPWWDGLFARLNGYGLERDGGSMKFGEAVVWRSGDWSVPWAWEQRALGRRWWPGSGSPRWVGGSSCAMQALGRVCVCVCGSGRGISAKGSHWDGQWQRGWRGVGRRAGAGRQADRQTAKCAGRGRAERASRRRKQLTGGSGVVRPSKDIQGLDVKAASANEVEAPMPISLDRLRAAARPGRAGEASICVYMYSRM